MALFSFIAYSYFVLQDLQTHIFFWYIYIYIFNFSNFGIYFVWRYEIKMKLWYNHCYMLGAYPPFCIPSSNLQAKGYLLVLFLSLASLAHTSEKSHFFKVIFLFFAGPSSLILRRTLDYHYTLLGVLLLGSLICCFVSHQIFRIITWFCFRPQPWAVLFPWAQKLPADKGIIVVSVFQM